MNSEPAASKRLLSLDVYRGFTMFLMVSAGFGFSALADNPGWEWLARQVEHSEWIGCTVWDLIQPSFIFIVGVAMPFAFAIRSARGESHRQQFYHAFKRSLILLILGIARYNLWSEHWVNDMTTVLQQIAVAYFFAFFVLGCKFRTQIIVAFAILIADWALFQFWPGAGTGWAYAKNANFHSAVEQLIWGRLDPGGYTGFNAFGSIATVIFGIIAGEMLRRQIPDSTKVKRLLIAGVAGIIIGLILNPVVPLVKRIWTPSWTIYSAGWASLLLGVFYWIIEVKNRRKWSFPFMVVGMNSIAIYMLTSMLGGSVREWLHIYFGWLIDGIGGDLGTIIRYNMSLLTFWYMVYWMYKRKIFLKVG